ncbi:hypothetical protein CC1G_09527 [Coprinopsis cinerea okayama7|uniref:Uncharacterized protein n=1 Tax=Coprinopsis cinerea (strain Okayama-7 / 130 / ATCC MYA-4618 / FGSC 9003) TaxID=240176 RepID=A8P0V7_COPC7|nr:hypothetical protein CC1G_09527 [Coprinopsis cinerea okayama7\|eukprot:XP_001837976.1 hypothetical protein CC1G_09527 [Coprinopsis cinerea okayama7\
MGVSDSDLDEKKPLLNEQESNDEVDDSKTKEKEPVSDEEHSDSEDEKSEPQPQRPASPDPRFNPPPPSPLKRFLLIVFVTFLLWLAYALRQHHIRKKNKPQIIYASRYSKEYKYRPAASPIITETLKDGRIRIRGASPEPTQPPPPPPPPKKRRTRRRRKAKKH